MPYTLAQFVESDRLPSLPQVALRVIELSREPEPDFKEVARVVRTDAAISGKLLRTTNSALYGLGKHVESVEAAIPLLGINLVRSMILGFSLAQQRSESSAVQHAMESLWRSSLTQAVFAEQIAIKIGHPDPPTFFLAGLLQDIGILCALNVDAENYMKEVWQKSLFPNVNTSERKYYGFTHCEIGEQVCIRWGLPDEFCKSVAIHHQRFKDAQEKPEPLFVAAQAASLCGQYVVNHQRSCNGLSTLCEFLSENYRWSAGTIESILCETMFQVFETASLFNFNLGVTFSNQDILSNAKDLLEDLSIVQQTQAVDVQKLRIELHKDHLTGAFNRRFMDQVLSEQLHSSISRRTPIGLFFIDIDRFKAINDTYGHQKGDEVIQEVASALKLAVGKSGVVIRYGGDEFLVALSGIRLDSMEQLAERIRMNVTSSVARTSGVCATVSIGAVYHHSQSGDSINANWLLDLADSAMYLAKREGGYQVRFDSAHPLLTT